MASLENELTEQERIFVNESIRIINRCSDIDDLTEGYEALLYSYYVTKTVPNKIMGMLIKEMSNKYARLLTGVHVKEIDKIQTKLNSLAVYYEKFNDNFNIIREFMKEL